MAVAIAPCARAVRVRPATTVNDALRAFISDFRRARSPSAHVDRVLDWLCACQTPALGGRLAKCACGWSRPVYNACGDRHCPQCRGKARAEWLAARQDQLLPVPHFQVVFTLPGVLRGVARWNPKVVYDALFRGAAETLQQLAGQRLDAQLGVLAVLHTWASDLSYHPHVHCLVTAGGLRQDPEAWVVTRPDYLFPTRVMAPLFRGKVLATLRAARDAGTLVVPDDLDLEGALKAAYRYAWVRHVEPPSGRPAEQAAKYLARYVMGVAIGDARMVSITATHVTYRTKGDERRVTGAEFVRRFAMHILPKGLRKVRYFGLYAPSNAHRRLAQARRLLGVPPIIPRFEVTAWACPMCGGPVTEVTLPDVEWTRPRTPPRARGSP